LTILLNTVKNTDLSKNLLIFNFGNKIGNLTLSNPDDFLQYINYYITWIAIFGLSKEQFNQTKYMFESQSRLQQVSILLELSFFYDVKVISVDGYFKSLGVINKGGYDLITVFIENYISILRRFLNKKYISNFSFVHSRNSVVFDFILPLMWGQISKSNSNAFDFNNRIFRISNALFSSPKMVLKYLYLELKFNIKLKVKYISPLKIVKYIFPNSQSN